MKLMTANPNRQILQIDPSDELVFKGPFADVVTAQLKLTNPSEKQVCFKVKTTAPQQYFVKPNSGLIPPKGAVNVAIKLQPFEYNAEEIKKNKHKFMVQTAFVSDEETSLVNIWKSTTPNDLMETKLRVVFEMPGANNADKAAVTSTTIEIPIKNWTKMVFQRQIFGKQILTKRISNSTWMERREPLRTYHLREMVPSLEDFEEIFMGFSLCGSYLFSYREVATAAEGQDDGGIFGILDTENTYTLNVWQFIPGDKLRSAFKVKLFGGVKFADSLSIRIQQHHDLPGGCVVTGHLFEQDPTTITKTLWHTVFFFPTAQTSIFDTVKHFVVFTGISSEFSLYGGFLIVVASDELILYDLNECRRASSDDSVLEHNEQRGIPAYFRQLGGQWDSGPRKYVSYFSYASQMLRWCTEDCEQTLDSSCVGLSDYHVHVDEISDGICNGSIIALYAVDADIRRYFEAMFTFRWDFQTGEAIRSSHRTNEVTDRSYEPRKQYQEFDKLRAELFGNLKRNSYVLDNISVLKGRSLQRIFDSTGHIALTL